MKRWSLVFVLLALTLAALLVRIPSLDRRPMHHDEANQAVRAGILQETGIYRYDPEDHHGPTLYYLTLPIALVHAGTRFAATTETTFRLVPVLFGVGLIPLLFLLRGALGSRALAAAALLTVISPAMVYYSRFYIQEMLLVFFTFGAIASGWRYSREPAIKWAVTCGVFLGLMFATKETSVLAFAAMATGLVVVLATDRSAWGPAWRLARRHFLWLAASAFVVAALFFSSFLTYPAGVIDSLLSFEVYLSRGLGESLHLHPWHFYLKILLYTHDGRGPIWTEGFILLLAVGGGCLAWFSPRPKAGHTGFVRFMGVYTLVLTLLYSVIAHKTPWCVLSFLHGMILLAGFALAALWGSTRHPVKRASVLTLFVAGFLHLGWLSWQANNRYEADHLNPYVYAHTSTDFLNLVERMHELGRVSPDGRSMFVQVVSDPYSMWPLPWYLRDFDQVGYWTDAAEALDTPAPAVVITTPELQESLSGRLEPYQGEFYGLRPSTLLLVYVKEDLWDRFLTTRLVSQTP
jgi:uncharacterized protein (TIGR03663 family)